jgi:hypothetical protein
VIESIVVSVHRTIYDPECYHKDASNNVCSF